jgi:hypothetical protein
MAGLEFLDADGEVADAVGAVGVVLPGRRGLLAGHQDHDVDRFVLCDAVAVPVSVGELAGQLPYGLGVEVRIERDRRQDHPVP